jgi:hypothetical protein
MATMRWMCVVLAVSAMAGCDRGAASSPAAEPVNASRFHPALLQIADEYKTWGRVDDEVRWAPFLCRAPNPGRVYMSGSADKETHGQKLYSLFALQRDAYVSLQEKGKADVGQAVVKESWIPEEVTDPKVKPNPRFDGPWVIRTPNPATGARDKGSRDDYFLPYAMNEGKLFRASKLAGLFVMMKTDPKTPETDGGWVYATITANGKSVTSAGRVESCMKCHQTKPARLFGVAQDM